MPVEGTLATDCSPVTLIEPEPGCVLVFVDSNTGSREFVKYLSHSSPELPRRGMPTTFKMNVSFKFSHRDGPTNGSCVTSCEE